MITTHIRKTDHGYTSYIKVYGGGKPYTIGSHITRLSREDAKRDAEQMKREMLAGQKP